MSFDSPTPHLYQIILSHWMNKTYRFIVCFLVMWPSDSQSKLNCLLLRWTNKNNDYFFLLHQSAAIHQDVVLQLQLVFVISPYCSTLLLTPPLCSEFLAGHPLVRAVRRPPVEISVSWRIGFVSRARVIIGPPKCLVRRLDAKRYRHAQDNVSRHICGGVEVETSLRNSDRIN